MPNEATSVSPAKLLFGYELRTPATWPAPRQDFVEGEMSDEIISRTKVIEHMVNQLREDAKEKAKQRKLKDKALYNQHMAYRRPFRVGEQVLMRDKYPKGKFNDHWLGPMVIVGVGNNGMYFLEGPNVRRLTGAINGDNLKAFFEHRAMIPDVQVQRAMQQFQAWIDRRRDD